MKRKERNYWKRGAIIGAIVGSILSFLFNAFILLAVSGIEYSLGGTGNPFPLTLEESFSLLVSFIGVILVFVLIGATIGFFIKKSKK